MTTVARVSGLAALLACAGALTACAGPALTIGPANGTVHICVLEFSQPMYYGDDIVLADGTDAVTLVRADLVGAEGVRIIEQAASRGVILEDGTHLGLGMGDVSGDDEVWNARIPLEGTVVRNDGGEAWFVALAIERTSSSAGGLEGVDLTYAVNGRQYVARSTQSMSFPAVGDECPE